ncbi:tungstate ABC transporter substrate-binding protein WtpA [Helicovermis profundi]|uniref:Tungstate ABC transporter substrate-binding protein WtpA n=1 Tax=Helicovermis profundi TaxID=3065157 RepID=A0AAU9E4Y7_9FIRM|nr:tungstate ABC transporter substrate-binding protein WtpA [Clostridia bacterium S502]
MKILSNKFTNRGFLVLIFLLVLVFNFGCSSSKDLSTVTTNQSKVNKKSTEKIVIYHAGSLSVPLEKMENEFEKKYPNIDVIRTPGGSRTVARKITELGDSVDILFSADYNVINSLVIPEFADFNLLFAKNSMVIMYSTSSKYADEITKDNWYDILTKNDVDFGYSDPFADPCGYRSLLLWQLAENYYKIDGLNDKIKNASKEKNIRPKAVELLSMLETGELDYAFEYESVAKQHQKINPDFKYISLPEEINLSSLKFKEKYNKAVIELNGTEPGTVIERKAEPIIYSLTIPKSTTNKDGAIKFITFLLSEEGQSILIDSGQPVLDKPKVINYKLMPNRLKNIIKE